MGEVPLSLHVKAETKRKLDDAAEWHKISTSELAERAIESFLAMQDFERKIIEERIAEADKGVFISSEAMLKWIETLETDINAPAPKPDVFLAPKR